jgi:predicted phage terminase large subunit-like protein
MAMDDRLLLRAVLHEDLPSFTRLVFKTIEPGIEFHTNWHNHALWEALRRVECGQCRRLIIAVPPRSGKSISVSIAFPAWLLGRNPTRKIMCLNYGNDLARKHAGDFRAVVESDWYGWAFPQVGINAQRQRNFEVTTASRGYRMASSMTGRIHGRGADLIIIDDPLKPRDAFSDKLRRAANETYDNAVYPRLNDKVNGAVIIVMQRLHEDDLVGHVLAQGDDWEVLDIPAIAPQDRIYRLGRDPRDRHHRVEGEVLDPVREPREALDSLRRTLGTLSFSAQYLQNPLPLEGNLVRREWLQYYGAPPEAFDLLVASWDPATTLGEDNDYSVGTIWGVKQGTIYLLDVLRGRYEAPDLKRLIVAKHRDYHVHATLIEDVGFGKMIGQDLRRTTSIRPIMRPVRADKTTRFAAQAPKFESGQVKLPREAPWLGEYLHELLGFPNAAHDDQVDSTSQALEYLAWRIGDGTPRRRPNPKRPEGLPLHSRPQTGQRPRITTRPQLLPRS